MYDICEQLNVEYLFGLSANKKLQKASETLVAEAVRKFDKTKTPQRPFDAFWYQAGTWEHSRWVIVRAEANAQGMDRNFTIDHVVRPGWTRLDEKGDPVAGPAVFRFKLEIAKGKTGNNAVREERTHADGGQLLKNLNETQIKSYLNGPAASADVKAAFTKALAMQAKIAETQTQIEAAQKDLTVVTTDNARVRENLKIIPADSEFYKPMLEKFVNQDKQIETQQNQIRTLTANVQTQVRDYDLVLSKLDAE